MAIFDALASLPARGPPFLSLLERVEIYTGLLNGMTAQPRREAPAAATS